MSDPLSIAAGIAGFLSLGIQVTQSLVDFYSVYKSRDTDIAKMTQNMENLQSTFRSLETAIHQRQSQPNANELLQEVDTATQRCHEIIQELQSECQKLYAESGTSLKVRFQAAGRRVTYPFRKSTLQKIEEDVRDIRENLLFALSVLQFESHNRIEDEISAARSLLERTNSSQISFAIRAWLQAPDVSINHNAVYAKHHPETGQWFINSHQFANWLVERNSFLWLNGFAGCGKSVLCSAIIQHIFRETKHKSEVGIAFYYFTFSDESKQDAHGMLRALLLQLSVQFPDGERELEQLRILSQSLTPSKEVLLQSLRRFLEIFQDSYIILDALDECPRDDSREDVLRVIQVIRDWCLPSVHLLVTGRDQLDIRRSLNPSHDCDLSMKNPGIDKDIFDFVSYQLENDSKLQRWKVRHSEIQNKLGQGAEGVFRYVECQLNSFRRARNRNQLDKCLHTLPRDLDETYERMLCDIEESYIQDVRRILTVLCFSIRPLTVKELVDAHSVELGESPYLDREGRSFEQDDLVDICLGLIEIVETDNGYGQTVLTARIAHFSVQEYLQSDRIRQQKAEIFAIDSGSANAELAQICLVYLLDSRLSDGILDEAKLQDFPLAHFAALYWHHFYQASREEKMKAEKLLLRLFQYETNSFVTWARLYETDRPCDLNVNIQRLMDDIASPIYYASFLGLEITLRGILVTYGKSSGLSDIVNAQGGHYGNALQAASSEGHSRVVQMLLDQGADVSARGGFYGNALQAASSEGHHQLVQMLLDQGADINAQGGTYGNAIQAASSEGHNRVVQMLLDQGANVNAQGGHYGNALQAASSGGHRQLVQMLLDQGADVSARGGLYGNALQAASSEGHHQLVQMLLDQGADVNARGGLYGNALQAASSGGYNRVVQMLLDQGADVSAQGGLYDNALQAASNRGHHQVAQLLLDQGADINA
ncbi:hypothetical protein N7476_007011 [Penicillium atrosanguineum]|uniref:NACHT domain-containing protein n=1 Tax=Penicillium atrosanguineum TaxID=1132637 RepID=A0A9W9PTJ0_9EURO|nr:hypothetical protein N7476_007011 [Penicillium atrosanguineum]